MKVLSLPFIGPHEVLSHEGNIVTCRHLATHQVMSYPSSRVKIFHGTLEDAKRAAEEDFDQSQVRAITAWKGNPLVKTTMSFRVEFADGDVIWLPYSKDLDETEAFGCYTASLPALQHLSYGYKRAIRYEKIYVVKQRRSQKGTHTCSLGKRTPSPCSAVPAVAPQHQ